MMEPIREYHVIEFDSPAKMGDAIGRFLDAFDNPSVAPHLIGPERLVIWAGSPATLYLSPRAFDVSHTLLSGLDAQSTQIIPGNQLPSDRVGIQTDQVDRQAQST
jgi:hypothetical protein